eukprot:COSAG06_NODE_6234_length_3026_cov_2.496071_3_plen_54_part_00
MHVSDKPEYESSLLVAGFDDDPEWEVANVLAYAADIEGDPTVRLETLPDKTIS